MAIKGKLNPLRDVVFVTDLEQGQRVTACGIVLTDDNGKDHGIRPRWGKVFMVGPEVQSLKPGDWVLVEHGRWTFGMEYELEDGSMTKIYRIDYNENDGGAVITVADDFPLDIKPLN